MTKRQVLLKTPADVFTKLDIQRCGRCQRCKKKRLCDRMTLAKTCNKMYSPMAYLRIYSMRFLHESWCLAQRPPEFKATRGGLYRCRRKLWWVGLTLFRSTCSDDSGQCLSSLAANKMVIAKNIKSYLMRRFLWCSSHKSSSANWSGSGCLCSLGYRPQALQGRVCCVDISKQMRQIVD